MKVFVSFDGDHIGRMVGRASLTDQPEEVAKIAQAIERGNEIWRSWVMSHGGKVINIGGDEGRLEVEADHLTELPKIRDQYQAVVGSTVSVGVGTKLSEADKSLMAAKLQGGDRIQLYTETVNELLEELEEKPEGEKLFEEYLDPDTALQKAQPGMNVGANAGFSGASRAAPAAPRSEASEHSEAEAARAVYGQPTPQPGDEASVNYEDLFHQIAAKAPEEVSQEPSGLQDGVRAQVVKILQDIRSKADALEQMRTSNPDAYESVKGLVQAMIAMAQGADGQEPVQKAEGDPVPSLDSGPTSVDCHTCHRKPGQPCRWDRGGEEHHTMRVKHWEAQKKKLTCPTCIAHHGVPIQKAEGKVGQCKWKLGERRCQRQVTGDYCHSHKDHWANKIRQRADQVKSELKKAKPDGSVTRPDGRVYWDLREPNTDDLPINKALPPVKPEDNRKLHEDHLVMQDAIREQFPAETAHTHAPTAPNDAPVTWSFIPHTATPAREASERGFVSENWGPQATNEHYTRKLVEEHPMDVYDLQAANRRHEADTANRLQNEGQRDPRSRWDPMELDSHGFANEVQSQFRIPHFTGQSSASTFRWQRVTPTPNTDETGWWIQETGLSPNVGSSGVRGWIVNADGSVSPLPQTWKNGGRDLDLHDTGVKAHLEEHLRRNPNVYKSELQKALPPVKPEDNRKLHEEHLVMQDAIREQFPAETTMTKAPWPVMHTQEPARRAAVGGPWSDKAQHVQATDKKYTRELVDKHPQSGPQLTETGSQLTEDNRGRIATADNWNRNRNMYGGHARLPNHPLDSSDFADEVQRQFQIPDFDHDSGGATFHWDEAYDGENPEGGKWVIREYRGGHNPRVWAPLSDGEIYSGHVAQPWYDALTPQAEQEREQALRAHLKQYLQANPNVYKSQLEKADLMPGGKGDNKPDAKFDADQLAAGIKREMEEHGLDEARAREIAKDHLTEDPKYYATEKAALDPGKTGRHQVVLPVGAQIDSGPSADHEAGKIKVRNPEDGKTKWRSVRAGVVMAPDGTPTSSRNPGG